MHNYVQCNTAYTNEKGHPQGNSAYSFRCMNISIRSNMNQVFCLWGGEEGHKAVG